MLTLDYLKLNFRYSEGKLYRKNGKEAGSLINGLLSITIKGKRYYIHKLIWMYFNGYYCNERLEHLDGNLLNNNIENLVKYGESKILNQIRLKTLLTYNPVSGCFFWKVSKLGSSKGDLAGTKSNGYIQIKIDGVMYKAHRLAWLYINGVWPINEIDHINQIKHDNRYVNLREATHGQNNCNKPSSNKLGFKGVRLTKHGKYNARIKVNKKEIHLGNFDTAEEAHEKYKKACEKYFPIFSDTTHIKSTKST